MEASSLSYTTILSVPSKKQCSSVGVGSWMERVEDGERKLEMSCLTFAVVSDKLSFTFNFILFSDSVVTLRFSEVIMSDEGSLRSSFMED